VRAFLFYHKVLGIGYTSRKEEEPYPQSLSSLVKPQFTSLHKTTKASQAKPIYVKVHSNIHESPPSPMALVAFWRLQSFWLNAAEVAWIIRRSRLNL